EPMESSMELREFADRVLNSASIADKLIALTGEATDERPGPPERIALPARPAELAFCERRQTPAMPHPDTLIEAPRRAIAHHIMANHELQALEVMAFVLRAFPEAPSEFRFGLARIMADEQRHTRMHLDRLPRRGGRLDDLAV